MFIQYSYLCGFPTGAMCFLSPCTRRAPEETEIVGWVRCLWSGCLMLDSFRSRKKSNSSSLFRRRPRKYWRRSVGGGGEAGKGRTPVPDTVMNRSSGGRLMFRPAGDFREIPQTMPQSFRARKLQYQCVKAAPGVLSCQPFRPARCVG